MKEFYRGEYQVINKEKYIGSHNPQYRSSWEAKLCYFLDNSSSIIKWSYESIEIPYFNPIDKKMHRYYPDFYCELIDKDGVNKKILVEVKPYNQTVPPKQPKNNNNKANKRYIIEAHEYVRNKSKWKAAQTYCDKKGMEFKIITGNEIFTK